MYKKYIAILLSFMMFSSIVSCGNTAASERSTEYDTTDVYEEEKVSEDASVDKSKETTEKRAFSIGGGMITAELPSEWNYDDSNDSMIYVHPSGNSYDSETFAVIFGDLGIDYSDNDIEEILEELGNEDQDSEDFDSVEIKDRESQFIDQEGFKTVFKQTFIEDYTLGDNDLKLYNEEYFYPINNDGVLAVMMIAHTYDVEEGSKYENEFLNTFIPAIKIETSTDTGDNGVIEKNTEVTFDESIVYDKNGIKAVLTGISDGEYGKNVNVSITNDSDRDISWCVDYIMVNDITIICAVSCNVPAGKTGTAEYPIEESYLQRFGISDIHTLQLACSIMDEESNDNTIYCMSEKIVTDLGADFELSLPIEDWDIVYESDSLKIYNTGVIEAAGEYDEFRSKVLLMCFNESDSTISISPEDVSFDGKMDYNNYFSFSVGPESYGEFYLASGEIPVGMEEAAFSLRVCDGETYEEKYTIDKISIDLR